MKAQEMVVGSKTNINVTLEEETIGLDEVVAVGYGTMKKSDLTGAISTVTSNVIDKSAGSNFLQAIQGKVAGVQILTSDGSPGGGYTIKIRGANSLTSGTSPLYVIDGFSMPISDDPANNPLAGINPLDIQSMEILKDASATSIYGAQGSNGVVLVTTKKGTAGIPKIGLVVKYGLSDMNNRINVLSPEDYAIRMAEVYASHFSQGLSSYSSKWDDIVAGQKWNVLNPHDWLSEITRVATKKSADLNFSGGKEGLTYIALFGVLDEEGIVINSKFNRVNGRFNVEQKLSSKSKIGSNLSFNARSLKGLMNDWREVGMITRAIYTDPYLGLVPFDTNDAFMNTVDPMTENPVNQVTDTQLDKKYKEFTGGLYFEYNLAKSLSFYTSYGVWAQDYKGTSYDGLTTWDGKTNNGRVQLETNEQYNATFENRLTFAKDYGKHSINAVGVFETKQYKYERIYNNATNLQDQTLAAFSASTSAIPSPVSYNENSYSMMSGLGRINYSFNGRYLLTTSLRADASSRFGKNNKWGYFPATAIAWRASEENFVKNLNLFSRLKFRGSFGITGNDQIPSYLSLPFLGSGRVVFRGSDGAENIQLAVAIGRIPNPDLAWEKTTQTNAGIDFGFLNNKLTFTADVYYKKTEDMLLDVQLPPNSGYYSATQNVGSMQNRGVELNMDVDVLSKKNFKWLLNFNISANRSKVLSLGDKYEMSFNRGVYHRVPNEVVLRVGEPIGTFYGFIQDGLYNNANEAANGPVANISIKAPGEVKFVDVNGDGIVDINDRVIIARTEPKHTGGFTNNFEWKGIDLSIFWRWSYGNDIINANIPNAIQTATRYNILQSAYNNLWFAGTNEDGNFPGYYNNGAWNYFRSDYVEDGSYLKLQNITVGYNFPKKITNALKVEKLRLSATGSNLYTLTRYSWFDPDVNTGWGTAAKVGPGVDLSGYPSSRTFLLSLELNF